MISYFKEIIFLLGENKKKVPLVIFFFIITSFVEVIGIGLVGPYIGMIINPKAISSFNYFNFLNIDNYNFTSHEIIIIISILLALVFFLRAIFTLIIKFYLLKFTLNQRVLLQSYLIRSYQNLPYVDFIKNNSSDYIETINSLAARYVSRSLQPFLNIISEGIIIVAIMLFLLTINPIILITISVILFLLIFIYDKIFKPKMIQYGENVSIGSKKLLKGVIESLHGMKEIKILNKQNFFYRQVNEGAKIIADNSIKSGIISTAPRLFLEFILILFIVSFIIFSLFLNLEIINMLPVLSMFGVAAIRLIPSANLLTSNITNLRFGRHATTELYKDIKKLEKFDLKENFEHKKTNLIIDEFTKLSFENVNFTYPGMSSPTLNNINFTFHAGEYIGLIGPSGVGKTTLVDLILGLLKHDSGEIYFNSKPLKNVLNNFRNQVAYIPQMVFLSDDTLKNNIALGISNKDIDNEKIKLAIEQAHLTNLVKDLPKGVDTFLGDRGIRISGGQRQRVALARAFYNEKNILIMDEATSSLDHEVEKQIVNEINKYKGNKTIIVITHRVSSLKDCDKIFRLENNTIASIGSYNEIVKKNKLNLL